MALRERQKQQNTHTHLKAIKIDCEWLSRYVKSISDRAAWGCLCQFSLTALKPRWHVSAVSELHHASAPHTHTRTHTFPECACEPPFPLTLPSLFLLLSLRSQACSLPSQRTEMRYRQRNGLPPAQTAHIISIFSADWEGNTTPDVNHIRHPSGQVTGSINSSKHEQSQAWI